MAQPPAGLLAAPDFRRGYALLGAPGLSFDAWLVHTQIGELKALAQAFPNVPVAVNHLGGPIGMGPYLGRRDAAFHEWLQAMEGLRSLYNVHVKLGGFGMPLFGFDFLRQAVPPGSEQVAAAIRPYVETCCEIFGPDRCMFESNFPVDEGSLGYGALWNAFKRSVQGVLPHESDALFSGTARRFYRSPGSP